MKQTLLILALIGNFVIVYSQSFKLGIDSTTWLSSGDTAGPKLIIDTVDAIVLIADWNNKKTNWHFVKAVRTGHRELVNDPSRIYVRNGVSMSDLVYRSKEITVWDDITYYVLWKEILYEGNPTWAEVNKSDILQVHFKPDKQ